MHPPVRARFKFPCGTQSAVLRGVLIDDLPADKRKTADFVSWASARALPPFSGLLC